MPLKLVSTHAGQIDHEIWDIYKDGLGGGELSQLAKLFDEDQGLPARLAKVFKPTLPEPMKAYRQEVDIKLAWIDKRPLAKLRNLKRRVELGDAAIFFFEVSQFPTGQHYRESRALILQAKVATTRQQLSDPRIPINPGKPLLDSSTANELELLSRWDTFDLYASAGSKTAIVTDVNAKPSSLPPANGWYAATPKVQPLPGNQPIWTSPWMCGPAKRSEPCGVTLGHLLLAFFGCSRKPDGSPSLPEVGVAFSYRPDQLVNPTGDGWDRICIEILRLCSHSKLPEHLFGNTRPKGATTNSVVRSLPYRRRGDASHAPRPRRRRMAVLIVSLRHIEG